MSQAFNSLKDELLDLITEAVNMKNLDRSTVTAETPVMVEGLALDSIDVLEVVISLEKKYNVKIANDEKSRMIFRSVGAIAEFVQTHRQNAVGTVGTEAAISS